MLIVWVWGSGESADWTVQFDAPADWRMRGGPRPAWVYLRAILDRAIGPRFQNTARIWQSVLVESVNHAR